MTSCDHCKGIGWYTCIWDALFTGEICIFMSKNHNEGNSKAMTGDQQHIDGRHLVGIIFRCIPLTKNMFILITSSPHSSWGLGRRKLGFTIFICLSVCLSVCMQNHIHSVTSFVCEEPTSNFVHILLEGVFCITFFLKFQNLTFWKNF